MIGSREHALSVVVPVYRGADTLDALVAELAPLTTAFRTPAGRTARVAEVLLVHDCGPDDSDVVIRRLAAAHDWVRPVWLSRNFGQHAATLAGMASSGGDWVATLDEDGQHDPAYLGPMLDRAMADRADVVYAAPVNPAPHGAFRNVSSRWAKRTLRWLTGNRDAGSFHSYRLVLGEVARSVAAYAGPGAYLDVALGWVARRITTCPVRLRSEGERASGYRLRTLLSHYWHSVLTGGTRLLRAVSVLGLLFATIGFALAVVLMWMRLRHSIHPAGWTSLAVVGLISSGTILLALGVIAEYVGVAVHMAMGRPLYLIVGDSQEGPLGADEEEPLPVEEPEPS
ncbi:glycosyltransferase [Nocardioides soli]|uniref:Undecaprenyl-phosphate 4-deoxy-4-formamido-L-arabinose transferase n=1 Tax=Nocardioides soli TaxID=1036020 RepID=A0A7W4W053_9ACTN|nr:undecaprenyl-phosphate 4-deoxy-4-formamido-L-arabinose transferase [Nocardioides soli]